MLRRILKLVTEWIATQNLAELIADHFAWEDSRLLEFIIFLARNLVLLPCLKVTEHMFIKVGQAIPSKKCNKIMFRVQFAFAWYFIAAIWLIPIYVILARIVYMNGEMDLFSYLFDDLSPVFLIASSCTAILFLAERKKPQLEEWADQKWGKSSQSYLDFCDRSISTLKFGLIFSIAFSSIPLIYAAIQL